MGIGLASMNQLAKVRMETITIASIYVGILQQIDKLFSAKNVVAVMLM